MKNKRTLAADGKNTPRRRPPQNRRRADDTIDDKDISDEEIIRLALAIALGFVRPPRPGKSSA